MNRSKHTANFVKNSGFTSRFRIGCLIWWTNYKIYPESKFEFAAPWSKMKSFYFTALSIHKLWTAQTSPNLRFCFILRALCRSLVLNRNLNLLPPEAQWKVSISLLYRLAMACKWLDSVFLLRGNLFNFLASSDKWYSVLLCLFRFSLTLRWFWLWSFNHQY